MRALFIAAVAAAALVVAGLAVEALLPLFVVGVLAFAATVVAAVPLARRTSLPSEPEQRERPAG
jgi:membrane protein implicated in regulation of membrane protease activity